MVDGFGNLLPERVVGITAVISVTPTISAGAYTATWVVGGKLTLANAVRVPAYTALLDSLIVLDKSGQNAALDIWLFSAKPAGTFADAAAPSMSDADLALVIGHVSVSSSDYVTIGGKGVACETAIALALQGSQASGRNLYAVITSPGGATYGSTSDLTLRFGFLQD
jgi:hypothetical protein